jgi:hypothetical protein
MALPPKLASEIEQLDLRPEVREDGGFINLIFKDFPIPPGYNRSTADLLVRMPMAYPDAGPDMFWTIPELTLRNGAAPQAGEQLEMHVGRQWRRFSWHMAWKPNAVNLRGFMDFIRSRLERAC